MINLFIFVLISFWVLMFIMVYLIVFVELSYSVWFSFFFYGFNICLVLMVRSFIVLGMVMLMSLLSEMIKLIKYYSVKMLGVYIFFMLLNIIMKYYKSILFFVSLKSMLVVGFKGSYFFKNGFLLSKLLMWVMYEDFLGLLMVWRSVVVVVLSNEDEVLEFLIFVVVRVWSFKYVCLMRNIFIVFF